MEKIEGLNAGFYHDFAHNLWQLLPDLDNRDKILLQIDIPEEGLWERWLNCFPEEYRQYVNCSACKDFFMRNRGMIIADRSKKGYYHAVWNPELIPAGAPVYYEAFQKMKGFFEEYLANYQHYRDAAPVKNIHLPKDGFNNHFGVYYRDEWYTPTTPPRVKYTKTFELLELLVKIHPETLDTYYWTHRFSFSDGSSFIWNCIKLAKTRPDTNSPEFVFGVLMSPEFFASHTRVGQFIDDAKKLLEGGNPELMAASRKTPTTVDTIDDEEHHYYRQDIPLPKGISNLFDLELCDQANPFYSTGADLLYRAGYTGSEERPLGNQTLSGVIRHLEATRETPVAAAPPRVHVHLDTTPVASVVYTPAEFVAYLNKIERPQAVYFKPASARVCLFRKFVNDPASKGLLAPNHSYRIQPLRSTTDDFDIDVATDLLSDGWVCIKDILSANASYGDGFALWFVYSNRSDIIDCNYKHSGFISPAILSSKAREMADGLSWYSCMVQPAVPKIPCYGYEILEGHGRRDRSVASGVSVGVAKLVLDDGSVVQVTLKRR